MPTTDTARLLLVLVAVLGLAVVPVVSAHGNDTAPDAPPDDATAGEWATWMETHMGPGTVEWMEDHMGLSVGEMAEDMADSGGADPSHGPHPAHDHPYGPDGAGHGPQGYGPCH